MTERKYDGRHAGAGDLGEKLESLEVLGPCPACGAIISTTHATNPNTGKKARALVHPMPFCNYFGETDPAQIEHDMRRVVS